MVSRTLTTTIEGIAANRLATAVVSKSQPLIRLLETALVFSAGRDDCEIPAPLFIVGAPRTGSTILYQALTNAFDVSFIDNLSCRYHRNMRFAMWLSHLAYGSSPHDNFSSREGDTSEFGFHAPCECGSFWYRWLPADRHFIDHQEIGARSKSEIQKEIQGVARLFRKALVLKNLNAGQRLRFLHETLPEARILFIRRDPRFVLKSLVDARRSRGIRPGQWWSIKPPDYLEIQTLPELDMCARQISSIDRQIKQDLRLFDASRVATVHFQALNEEMLRELAEKFGFSKRPGGSIPVFRKDRLSSLGVRRNRLEASIGRFEFDEALFI